MIKRDKNINELFFYKDIKLIKVITGIRKSGKSTIMQQYCSLLKKENKDNNIIFIDFNDYETSVSIKNNAN
jgi:predicted AAA+ superfamily ATPase